MDRLERLERGWLFYKLRQLSKTAFVLIAAIAIGAGAVYLALRGTQQMLQEPATAPQVINEPEAAETEKPKELPSLRRESGSDRVFKLAPNYDFEQEIERRVRPAGSVSTPQQPAQPLSITRIDSLEGLKNAFNDQPTYNKAVEVAEAYLSQNNSAEALKWALKANEINNEDERSWTVFAIASRNLGRKEQAINALKAYLAAKPSDKLGQLLVQLEQP